jgi:hypothetical protein
MATCLRVVFDTNAFTPPFTRARKFSGSFFLPAFPAWRGVPAPVLRVSTRQNPVVGFFATLGIAQPQRPTTQKNTRLRPFLPDGGVDKPLIGCNWV